MSPTRRDIFSLKQFHLSNILLYKYFNTDNRQSKSGRQQGFGDTGNLLAKPVMML